MVETAAAATPGKPMNKADKDQWAYLKNCSRRAGPANSRRKSWPKFWGVPARRCKSGSPAPLAGQMERYNGANRRGPGPGLFYFSAPRAPAPLGARALGSDLTGAIPHRMPRAISIMLVRANSRSAEEMDCFSPFRVSEMVSRVAALLPLRAAL